MKYCSIVIFILLWFITIVKCDRVCNVQKGEKKCCIHYKHVNGSCIECPKGWYGYECRLSCPDGYYGVFCKETCSCTTDQICDIQEGCVHNKTVECPKGLIGDNCKLPCPNGFHGVSCKETCKCATDQICDVQKGCINYNKDKCPRGSFGGECQLLCPTGRYGVACNETCNCTGDQICNAEKGCVYNNTDNTLAIMETTSTEQQTTKSNGYHELILWNHLYGVPFGVVIIGLIILLVHSHRKKNTDGPEDESRHDQQDPEAESQAVELSQNAVQSDYAEICEVNATYSHTLTFSSDYNELSFSRSRWDRSTESHYDTSKNCLLKIKESKSESKPDVGGNPYSLAKPLMDTGNEVQQAQISEVKEWDVE